MTQSPKRVPHILNLLTFAEQAGCAAEIRRKKGNTGLLYNKHEYLPGGAVQLKR